MGLERVIHAFRKAGLINAFLDGELRQATSEVKSYFDALSAQTEKSNFGHFHLRGSILCGEFDPDSQVDTTIRKVIGDNPQDIINIDLDVHSGYYVSILNPRSDSGIRLTIDEEDGRVLYFGYGIGSDRQSQFSQEELSRLKEIDSKYHLKTIAGAALIKAISGIPFEVYRRF